MGTKSDWPNLFFPIAHEIGVEILTAFGERGRVSGAAMKRKELGKFLHETGSWSILSIRAVPEMGRVFDITLGHADSRQHFWRLHAIGTADFAIRPRNRMAMVGGPHIRLITDDPRLSDPRLQCVPGGDGEIYQPPRRHQLLELEQSWIVAERFEIEPLPQVTTGFPR